MGQLEVHLDSLDVEAPAERKGGDDGGDAEQLGRGAAGQEPKVEGAEQEARRQLGAVRNSRVRGTRSASARSKSRTESTGVKRAEEHGDVRRPSVPSPAVWPCDE